MDIKASSNYSTLLIIQFILNINRSKMKLRFLVLMVLFATSQGFVGNLGFNRFMMRHEMSDSDAPKELKKLV